MKTTLNSTKHIVEQILVNDPRTRSNDNLLLALYFRIRYGTTDILELSKICKHNEFESVRRARQRIQRDNPTLKARKDTAERRAEAEEVYRDVFRD